MTPLGFAIRIVESYKREIPADLMGEDRIKADIGAIKQAIWEMTVFIEEAEANLTSLDEKTRHIQQKEIKLRREALPFVKSALLKAVISS